MTYFLGIIFQTLYNLGARKFLVSGISFCEPYNYTQTCESRYYADMLPLRLLELQSELPGTLYTIFDRANIYKRILENHKKYGKQNYLKAINYS